MPNREIHKLISETLFGESGEDIHKWMDEPSKWLGVKHRSQRHDLTTLAFLLLTKGKRGAEHGLMHVATDKAVTKVKRDVNRMIQKGIKNFLNKLGDFNE